MSAKAFTRKEGTFLDAYGGKLEKDKVKGLANRFYIESGDTINAASVLLANGDSTVIFVAGFIVHLAFEQLLKSVIVLNDFSYPRTHDLCQLFEKASFSKKGFTQEDRDILKELNAYHKLRYPDEEVSLKGLVPLEEPGISHFDVKISINFYYKLGPKAEREICRLLKNLNV